MLNLGLYLDSPEKNTFLYLTLGSNEPLVEMFPPFCILFVHVALLMWEFFTNLLVFFK
jgi:hypothetical protein